MNWWHRLLCWIGFHDPEAIGKPVPLGWRIYVWSRCKRCGTAYLDRQE